MSKADMDEIRYRIERRKLSLFEFLRLWWRGIWDAVRTPPDSYCSEYIRLKKGDPGYDDAPFEEHIIWSSDPPRFTRRDGSWVLVKEEREGL